MSLDDVKNRPHTKGDVMKLEDVKKLSAPDRLCYFIKERRQIQVKRAAGLPKPWTNDPILQSYRFCNVRRMDDKVSDWLWRNWYCKTLHLASRFVLPTVVVARHFNNIPMLQEIPFPPGKYWLHDVEEVALQRRRDGKTTFNSAYVISGGTGGKKGSKYGGKIEMVMSEVIGPMAENPPTIYVDSMQRTHEQLCMYRGIASFMAGQIVADLRWAVEGGWKDKDTWAPFGPGSQRGMCRYYGMEPKDNAFRQPQFLENLKEIRRYIESKVRVPGMEMMDYQNCLCEYDKHSRTLFATTTKERPKQLYDGRG